MFIIPLEGSLKPPKWTFSFDQSTAHGPRGWASPTFLQVWRTEVRPTLTESFNLLFLRRLSWYFYVFCFLLTQLQWNEWSASLQKVEGSRRSSWVNRDTDGRRLPLTGCISWWSFKEDTASSSTRSAEIKHHVFMYFFISKHAVADQRKETDEAQSDTLTRPPP